MYDVKASIPLEIYTVLYASRTTCKVLTYWHAATHSNRAGCPFDVYLILTNQCCYANNCILYSPSPEIIFDTIALISSAAAGIDDNALFLLRARIVAGNKTSSHVTLNCCGTRTEFGI